MISIKLNFIQYVPRICTHMHRYSCVRRVHTNNQLCVYNGITLYPSDSISMRKSRFRAVQSHGKVFNLRLDLFLNTNDRSFPSIQHVNLGFIYSDMKGIRSSLDFYYFMLVVMFQQLCIVYIYDADSCHRSTEHWIQLSRNRFT